MSISIDFNSIRAEGGSQQDGFEELCCQIARLWDEVPGGSKFTRKGLQDSGIECKWDLPDGEVWGWQAKFFDQLDSNQLQQLDDSVEAALDNHPKLSKYIVCVPYDRPDPDLDDGRKKTALEKWESRVEKWEDWAEERGMDVEFIYWGESELKDFLSQDEFRGRLDFWFEKEQMTEQKLQEQINIQVANAGPRYTPELDVDLPISRVFESLGRTPDFVEEFQNLIDTVQEKSDEVLEDGKKSKLHNLATDEIETVDESTDDISKLSRNIDKTHERIRLQELREAVEDGYNATFELYTKAREKRQEEDSSYEEWNSIVYSLDELRKALDQLRDFLNRDSALLMNDTALCLTGEAGVGKTHLFCDISENRIDRGLPTVLVLGDTYRGGNPWNFITEQIGFNGGVDRFLQSLDAFGEARGCRSLILVDGLNESDEMSRWEHYLPGMLEKVKNYPYVSLGISLRSDYERWIIPDSIGEEDLIQIRHPGFVDREYDAAKNFFDYYGLERPSVPLLSPEFQKPLFLKLFCKSLDYQDVSRVPPGSQSLTQIFNYYLESIHEELHRPDELDYDPDRNLVKEGVEALARKMAEDRVDSLPKSEARDILDDLFESDGFANSLYNRLKSEDAISEFVDMSSDSKAVRLPYQKFSDHFIAKEYLNLYLDRDNPEDSLSEDEPLGNIITSPGNYGLVQAFAIQLPERIDRELFEFFDEGDFELYDHAMVEPFLDSLVWRDPESLTDSEGEIKTSVQEFIEENVRTQHLVNKFFNTVLSVSLNPGHPFNAGYLHQILVDREVGDRDGLWSIYLHNQWDPETGSQIARIIDWSQSIDRSDLRSEQRELLSITLSWFLTSSNRYVRDLATKSLVNTVDGDFNCWIDLIRRFHDVSDPYVLERVYAASYGATLRNREESGVVAFAEEVYQLEFEDGEPYPHLQIRDYARGIIECVATEETDLDVNRDRIRPPYNSSKPEVPDSSELEQVWRDTVEDSNIDVDNPGFEWSGLVGSDYEGDGSSDFARYTVGNNTQYYLKGYNFTTKEALRWIVKRVLELGWTPDRFKRFDDRLKRFNPNRGTTSKPERIGKKYQWIAYYELLAKVFDNYHSLSGSVSNSGSYEGPWEFYDRDIDPSVLLPQDRSEELEWDPFSEEDIDQDTAVDDWITSKKTPNLEKLLEINQDGENWLNLQSYNSYRASDRRLWCHCYGLLVREKEADRFEQWLKGEWAEREERQFKFSEPVDSIQIFFGEYPWHSSVDTSRRYWDKNRIAPVPVTTAASSLTWEANYDCSVDEGYTSFVPSPLLFDIANLKWNNQGLRYTDPETGLTLFDPSIDRDISSVLLASKTELREAIENSDYRLFLYLIGEKQQFGSDLTPPDPHEYLEIRGGYSFEDGDWNGEIHKHVVDPTEKEREMENPFPGDIDDIFEVVDMDEDDQDS